jgi:hypothetical protein
MDLVENDPFDKSSIVRFEVFTVVERIASIFRVEKSASEEPA